MKQRVRSKKVKVPVIMQMEALECGAASLCMILAYYKKWVPLEKVREDCGVSRDGSTASSIVKAARAYGLETKAHRYSPESTKTKVHYPAIIHWNFNHFVVLCGFAGDKVVINDPARGTVKVSMEEYDHSFTGVCLEFEPGPNFQPEGKPQSVLTFVAKRLKKTVAPVLFVMLASALCALVGLVTPAFSRVFTDRILTGQNPDWSAPFFLGLLGALVFMVAANIIKELYLYKIKGKLAVVSNANFMWHILHLPMSFFSQRLAGDLAGRQKLNDNIAQTLISKLAPVLIQILLLIFYLVAMIRYSYILTAVGCAAILLNLVISQVIARLRVQTTRVRMRDQGKLSATALSGIDMIETIKASGAENGFFERWAGYQAAVLQSTVKEARQESIFASLPVLVQELSNAAILTIGVWMVMDGHFTVGMLVAFQSLIQQFMDPVESLLDIGQSVQEMRTSMERVEDVMKYPEDTLSNPSVEQTQEERGKLTGSIEIRNVTFGYSKLAEPLLKNFSLTIHPGEKVAFVGPSGCGKSTIAKLISGLYKPWEGEILYDGKPINEIPREIFTGSLSVVDQDITMFEDSIANNIKMWDKAIADYEMIMAARDAQIHQDIMMRPGGYNYQISSGGRNFSGGQRQRFEIARVLAGDPTIAILDEATSALDAKTEYQVTKAIKDRGITCLVVAHRLSTIRDCDQIIVLSHGEVMEKGTHEELYQLGGMYTQLITME